MSADASAGATGGPEVSTVDYDAMLQSVDTAIAEAERKIEEGRVRDPEREKVRIKWCKCLAYCMNVRRQISQDRDLQALAEEVERLKTTREV